MTLSWRLHRRHTFTVSKLLLMLRMSPEPRDHMKLPYSRSWPAATSGRPAAWPCGHSRCGPRPEVMGLLEISSSLLPCLKLLIL